MKKLTVALSSLDSDAKIEHLQTDETKERISKIVKRLAAMANEVNELTENTPAALQAMRSKLIDAAAELAQALATGNGVLQSLKDRQTEAANKMRSAAMTLRHKRDKWGKLVRECDLGDHVAKGLQVGLYHLNHDCASDDEEGEGESMTTRDSTNENNGQDAGTAEKPMLTTENLKRMPLQCQVCEVGIGAHLSTQIKP